MIPLFWLPGLLSAQSFSIRFQPVWGKENIVLDEPMRDRNGDSLTFHEFKFYLGNFDFLKNGAVIFREASYRLLDLEELHSLYLHFVLPENLDFDRLRFDFGVDSLTNVSGALGGDLDPTRGMYWTWQSGYINLKMAGFHEKCPARKQEFEFHLGGYLPPFQAVQAVILPSLDQEKMQVDFDLAPFFEQIDWAKHHNVMSPGAEAVQWSEQLSRLFVVHEK